MWDDWCCTAHVVECVQALFVTVPSKGFWAGMRPPRSPSATRGQRLGAETSQQQQHSSRS
eukprot:5446700-Prymnesium_polylepis.1